MSSKQKIVHGRGPSNLLLASLFAVLMFARLPNHSPILIMILLALKRKTDSSSLQLITPLNPYVMFSFHSPEHALAIN